MTIPELRTFASHLMEAAVADLRSRDGLDQMFVLMLPDKQLAVLELPGFITNSERGKALFAQVLKKIVREKQAVAVAMISDVWIASSREELLDDDGRRLTVTEAHDRGLVEKQEAVVIIAESRDVKLMLTQAYHRDAEGKVVDLVGEPVVFDDTDPGAQLKGRFVGYFD